MAVAVRSVTVKPMRDRRRKRVEAKVFDQTGPMVAVWWNQPWIARQLGEGSQVLLHGTLKQRNQFHVKEFEPFGGGEAAPVHTVGLVPVHPATALVSAQTLRKLVWEEYGRIRHVIEPLPAALRTAERLPDRPAALAGAHFPDTEDDEAGRAPAAGVRGAVPVPAGGGGPPPGPRRRAQGTAGGGRRLAGRPVGGRAAVRAHGRPGGRGGRDPRRPGRRGADAAAADGGGGLGQDGGGAAGDAARAGGGRPGRADGADRDAGRAAPDHPRPAAGRGGAG